MANITAHPPRKKMKLETRNALIGMSFILPNFAGFFIFIFIPVLFSLFLSFTEWNGFNAIKLVGLDNFIFIFGDKYFIQALGRTMIYTVFVVAPATMISLGLAILLNKKIFAKAFFRSSIFFPYVASVVAVGAVWRMMFMRDFGPINELLRFSGIQDPPGWIASTQWALPAVIIVSVWRYMGYFMIVYLAALQDIPTDLREASAIDGANGFQHFRRITLPLLAPATFFVVLMLTINSFKSFDLIYVLTEGGPGQATTLLVNYIYNKGFMSERYGIASAAAMVLFVLVALITVIQFRFERRSSR